MRTGNEETNRRVLAELSERALICGNNTGVQSVVNRFRFDFESSQIECLQYLYDRPAFSCLTKLLLGLRIGTNVMKM